MAGHQNQSMDNLLETGSHLNPDQARTIAQLFQDVAHGLPPALSTSMFQNSIQSVKDLARVLVDFFYHGLKNFKVLLTYRVQFTLFIIGSRLMCH